MTNRIGIVLAAALSLLGCDDPALGPSDLAADLEKAYAGGSIDNLDRILATWRVEARPDSPMNPLQHAVHDVYRCFYTPHQLARFGGSEFGDSVYTSMPWFIAQASFSVDCGSEHDTMNTRVPIEIADRQIVHLTKDHDHALRTFLDRGQVQQDTPRRVAFLRQRFLIFPGHWGGWQLLTHPEVLSLELSGTLDSATIQFRLFYEGGESQLVKTDNGWVMTSSRLTWIE